MREKGSGRYAGVGVAKLCAHRTVIYTLTFLALIRVDGEYLFDVADSLVRTFGFAGAAAVTQVGNNFVSHDALLK